MIMMVGRSSTTWHAQEDSFNQSQRLRPKRAAFLLPYIAAHLSKHRSDRRGGVRTNTRHHIIVKKKMN